MKVSVLEHPACPKCDFPLLSHAEENLFKIDVCHDGEDWPAARKKILDGLDRALLGGFGGLVVVHGFGSKDGHTAIIKAHASTFLMALSLEKKYRIVRSEENPGETVVLF
jgi:hypothetical protein